MIVAEIKPLAEIKEIVKKYKKALIVGCGTCVTVCLRGGKKQVELLASALRTLKKMEGEDVVIGERTIPRQCELKFIEQMKDEASQYDAILSMGCGAGVQSIADNLENIPVLPAMNTLFIGASNGRGAWIELCAACGDCILWRTGGICPVARCAKSLTDGPCGGAQAGHCEVAKDTPCAWQLIYARLLRLGQLHLLKETSPPKARRVHPARLVRDG